MKWGVCPRLKVIIKDEFCDTCTLNKPCAVILYDTPKEALLNLPTRELQEEVIKVMESRIGKEILVGFLTKVR